MRSIVRQESWVFKPERPPGAERPAGNLSDLRLAATAGSEIDGNARGNAEADAAADFLLLGRTGDRDFGVEFRKRVDVQADRL